MIETLKLFGVVFITTVNSLNTSKNHNWYLNIGHRVYKNCSFLDDNLYFVENSYSLLCFAVVSDFLRLSFTFISNVCVPEGSSVMCGIGVLGALLNFI